MRGARLFPIEPEWAERVRATLRALDKSAAWLSRQVGVSRPTITNILNLEVESSEHVPRICEVLKIKGPANISPRHVEPLVHDLYEQRMLAATRKAKKNLTVDGLENAIREFENKAAGKPTNHGENHGAVVAGNFGSRKRSSPPATKKKPDSP